MAAMSPLAVVCGCLLACAAAAAAASSLYPVEASWFRDRFTAAEWDETLALFQAQVRLAAARALPSTAQAAVAAAILLAMC